MPHFGGRLLPLIVATVEVANRRVDRFCDIEVIERGQIDRDVVPADFFDVAAPEGTEAAPSVEEDGEER